LTVPKSYWGTRVGAVADAELHAVSRALAAEFGITKDDAVPLQRGGRGVKPIRARGRTNC
jgi:hypothetical protein